MEYFKSEVMEMCHREGLYQIDLLNGSKERITEREYWAAKKGQLALDKENAAREAAGPVSYTHLDVYKRQILHFGATKTKVVRPMRSKYLGFTFLKNGGEWKVKPTNEKKKKRCV